MLPDELPPVVADRYERRGLLGRGGMGSVWRMHDRALGRSVAMKLVGASHPAGTLRARFEEEVRIAARLQHPGLVPVHDFGTLPDGRAWFVMQVVRGRTLQDALVEVHRSLRLGRDAAPDGTTPRRLLESFLRACEAVAYAHARGVVHRDIKPSNVMLGAFGEVFVMDWGLARVLSGAPVAAGEGEDPLVAGPRTTRHGAITGTPSYLAPEQAQGRSDEAGPAADVHALGATLYDLLCDRPPRTARTVELLLYKVAAGKPVEPPSAHGSGFPIDEELDRICLRALAHDPSERQATAGVLAAELAAWLDGARKRERAMQLVDEAEVAVSEATAADARGASRLVEAGAAAKALGPRAPEEQKRGVWALEDAAAEAWRQAEDARTRAVQALRSALSHAPGLPEAEERLADLFHARHRRLEAAGRHDDARAVAADLARHDIARRFSAYLEGTGAVTLVTEPAGAIVDRWRVVERHRRRVLEPAGSLGPTPLVAAPLPRGAWVLRARSPGRPEVTVPVWIGRNEHWDGVPPGSDAPHPIALPAVLGPDEVYVPAGWFRAGTERFEYAHPFPPRRVWVDGFVVERFPVTLGGYLAFLDALVAAGREEEALRWQPRVAENDEALLERDAAGRFVGIRRDRSGSGWDHLPRSPDVPVTLVDWHSATAYASWRAARDGLPWRLPTDLEWQKAARGTDGREYPWGDHFEPGWCRSQGTSDPATVGPVTEHPTDESPYGVRGMAGNVQEWLLGVHDPDDPGRLAAEEPGRRWCAGGFASAGPSVCTTSYRARSVDYFRGAMRGFRLVRPVGDPAASVPRPEIAPPG